MTSDVETTISFHPASLALYKKSVLQIELQHALFSIQSLCMDLA